MNELWDEIKEFYKNRFGIEPELVEIMSDLNILRLCAGGTPTWRIAKVLGLELEEVEHTLENRLEMSGWIFDISFSPLRIYKELENKNLDDFKKEVAKYASEDDVVLERMFLASEVVTKLERMLDDEWV